MAYQPGEDADAVAQEEKEKSDDQTEEPAEAEVIEQDKQEADKTEEKQTARLAASNSSQPGNALVEVSLPAIKQ